MPSSGCKKRALDRKSTRLNSSHTIISHAVFCLKKKRLSGIGAAQRLTSEFPAAKVAILAMHDQLSYVMAALEEGVSGYFFFKESGDHRISPFFPTRPSSI